MLKKSASRDEMRSSACMILSRDARIVRRCSMLSFRAASARYFSRGADS
jgi:hypothetical protein